MPFKQEIRNLLKNNVVIRHRTDTEVSGTGGGCCICTRKIKMLPGNLCLAVTGEGLLCEVCATEYAPEMAATIHHQLPEPMEPEQDRDSKRNSLSTAELEEIAKEIEILRDISNDLAKGIARGIVEAPAGHIGLLHYAKNIQKPPKKENESEKEYALRVRTHRMTKLYEIISGETVGRIDWIRAYLVQLGLPDRSS